MSTALLLLLLEGCATTGVEISPEQEVTALGQAFLARLNLRYKEYYDTAAAAKAELTAEGYERFHGLLGRMKAISNWRKIPASISIEQWYAGEMDRIAREEARAETGRVESQARMVAWRADNNNKPVAPASALFQQALGYIGRGMQLEGEKMEMAIVMLDAVTYLADVEGVYQREEDRKIAAERAQQQSLLILFGGLQQLNYNLQEQDRYNQQQRYQQEQQFYQQQLLHELSKPIRCQTFGATTTCN